MRVVVMRAVYASLVVIGAVSLLWSGPRESKVAGEGGATVASGAAGETKSASETKVVGEAKVADEDKGKFVVHEWGTFTSITGSDGSRLEFRPLVHNDLPYFVVNRAWQAGKMPNPFGKWDVRTLQRMETPVTYFYTDRERDVDVKVGFPLGLLTEFYPPVVSMKPAFDFKKRAEIGKSELNWGRVTLIPPEHLMPHVSSPEIARAAQRRIVETLAPNSYSHPHYAHARDTDSAFVHVKHAQDNERPAAPAGDHFEKFLFYRGVGNFPLPLSVTALGNDSYEVTNKGAEELRSLFLVTSGEAGLQVTQVSRIEAGAKLTIRQSPTKVDSYFLANLVQKALVGEGLYEKEATAMVNTWRDSWFAEHGTRLFYMLPQRVTDELLPLTISPAPDKILRVMVGRMEVLSPEEEIRIAAVVRASAESRAAAAKAKAVKAQTENAQNGRNGERTDPTEPTELPTARPLPKTLAELGRFAEPALIRVKGFSNDPALRAEASLLLAELQASESKRVN